MPNLYCAENYPEGELLGSLIVVNHLEEEPVAPEELTLFNMDYEHKKSIWNLRRVLSQKYTAVCTNPPYLNKYNSELKDYVQKQYKDYCGDLFSVFMYRNFDFCTSDGYSAFMTPFVWMFIKTYEKLRDYIIDNKSITTLVQMEYSAYEEATVPICTFVLKTEHRAINHCASNCRILRVEWKCRKSKLFRQLRIRNVDIFMKQAQMILSE